MNGRLQLGGGFTLRQIAPNFCTLLAACAGLAGIRMAVEKHFDWALAAILLAAVLDALDGLVARILNAQSRFGAEFDSLADVVNFGVAPAVLMFTWSLFQLNGLGWAAVTVYTLACCVRLARFNAMREVQRQRWQEVFFTGVPAPAGAILVMLPLYLERLAWPADMGLIDYGHWAPWLIAANTIVVAALLVSTIPTYSAKPVLSWIERQGPLVGLALAAAVIGLLLRFPYETMAGFCVIYLGLIPWGAWRYRRMLASAS